ncbi:MAG: hypothetical protein HFJ42_09265 [Clostridia bacterium]|nr:hypothetical protein [Clostridia bacterium]
MSRELERIRFEIAVQREVIRQEKKKASQLFEQVQQQESISGCPDPDARDKEFAQRLSIRDEEKKLRDLQKTEQECLYRKR